MAQEGAQESEIWNHVLLNQIEAEDSMGIAASLVDDIVESAAALAGIVKLVLPHLINASLLPLIC